MTLVTAALLLAACGDDGDAGGSEAVDELPMGSTSGGGLPGSVEEVHLHDLYDAGDERGLVDGVQPEVLGDLLGDRPIVLNFFASWCTPCIEEMPDLETVHQDAGDEVLFIGLAYLDGDARAREIVETTGVTYPTYADVDGDALLFFESVAMPTTVFVAPDGEVLDVHSGELDEDELRDEIREHFQIGRAR